MAATSLPRITITRHPAGHQITCAACPDLIIVRAHRADADMTARRHQREHAGAPDTLTRLLTARTHLEDRDL